jgi:uncharacterized protein
VKRHPPGGGVGPGVFRGKISFDDPVLHGWRWPCFEVTGTRPGPHLCVMAGVHVNEVSSIEAAIRLQACFAPETLRGSVSILPIVNLPALYQYTQYDCPIDGRNINFTFPGQPGGTFSEALCHALLFDWAREATVHMDLHGGDLRERVSHFVMYQRSRAAADDQRREALAHAFDADLIVGFKPSLMSSPGRAITALAAVGRDAVMSEAGSNGVVDENAVHFHVGGVLNVARSLGMIDGPPSAAARRQVVCGEYLWVECPAEGLVRLFVEVGQPVAAGQLLGVVRNPFGAEVGRIQAPADGHVLWCVTHPVLRARDFVLGLGLEARPTPR